MTTIRPPDLHRKIIRVAVENAVIRVRCCDGHARALIVGYMMCDRVLSEHGAALYLLAMQWPRGTNKGYYQSTITAMRDTVVAV